MKKKFSALAGILFCGSVLLGQGTLTSENFNNYSPTLTGSGASGTWNINIGGSADAWGGKLVNYANFHGPLDVNGLLGTNTSYPGVVTAFSSTAVKGWLNETLQSIIDRGNGFNKEFFSTHGGIGRRMTVYHDGYGYGAVGQESGTTYLSATLFDRASIGHMDPSGVYSEKISALPNGNVGIGTTTPSAKLTVNGTAAFLTRIGFNSTNQYLGDGYMFSNAAGGVNDLGIRNDNGSILLATGGPGAQFILNASGNIGVGTTNPTSKLDVTGMISSGGNSTPGSGLLNSMWELNNGIRINGSIPDVSQNGISYQSGGGGAAAISFFRGGGYDTGMDFYTNPGSNQGFGYMIHRMRLTESGSLGIGTTNPGSCKLAVEGTIGAHKVKVTQNGWSDYVFDSSYQLPTLHQVEEYIQQNKHLPEIPSAAEIKKEGLDLGGNQALLLKKIEELTLYIINQDKRIRELESKAK